MKKNLNLKEFEKIIRAYIREEISWTVSNMRGDKLLNNSKKGKYLKGWIDCLRYTRKHLLALSKTLPDKITEKEIEDITCQLYEEGVK